MKYKKDRNIKIINIPKEIIDELDFGEYRDIEEGTLYKELNELIIKDIETGKLYSIYIQLYKFIES